MKFKRTPAKRGGDAARWVSVVAGACRRLETATEGAPSLAALADAAGMSPFHFHRVFKKLTGVTPKVYAKAVRENRMRGLLESGGATVTTALYEAGYGSSGRFYADSEAALGMKPKNFRARGAGETLRFAIGECSLGSLLVASTAKGVCAVFLGDDPESLVRDLQDRFRNAELVGGDAAYEKTVALVAGLVESPGSVCELPLDVRGTAFQLRVWEALRKIPAGRTMTYGEVAALIGSPGASRAVGSACGANPVSVAIPCHRVVCSDGSLHGYRWGLERKRELLRREGASPELF